MNNTKFKYYLEGLDCANCAEKIRHTVEKWEDVSTADMNFLKKELSVTFNMEQGDKDTLRKIKEIVNRLEPDVVVTETKSAEVAWTPKNEIIQLSIAAFLFIVGTIIHFAFHPVYGMSVPYIAMIGTLLTSYVIVGFEIMIVAVKNIAKGRIFDENFLMLIATIGAICIGEYPEAVAIMLFYRVGELLQKMAVNNSRKSIAELMNIRPDYANMKFNGEIVRVEPAKIKIGDTILVKPGEKIPLDGEVISGNSYIDSAALTGESVPTEVMAGSTVLSGCINKNGVLEVLVTKTFENSTASKILELVENASSKKSKAENFITKFARIYTPCVVAIAFLLAVVPILLGENAGIWIQKSLIFLVVSCPCALVISVPLSFFSAIGSASKKGILVKGSNYFEILGSLDTVVFDKTGTLTKGNFKVSSIHAMGMTEEELLKYAAYSEYYSDHPLALSIKEKYGNTIDESVIKDYNEIPGKGITVKINDHLVSAGNSKLMLDNKIMCYTAVGTNVQLCIDGNYAGYIEMVDEIKENSAKAISQLKEIGIKNIIMLTGDKETTAATIAKKVNIDKVYSELLPQDKLTILDDLEAALQNNYKLAFIGDGINDAPALIRADVGVAMGALGSDSAIEAADIVLMKDDPLQLVDAISIAKRTKMIVQQNIVLAIGVKFIIQFLAMLDFTSVWAAVFADVGITIIAIFNALRLLKK